jgi:hypothetical protein
MKTKSHNFEELGSRSGIITTAAANSTAPARKDDRLPIDRDARKRNRTFPTPKVLNWLRTTLPDAYGLAEVVGRWVWVQFQEKPAADIRQQLVAFESFRLRVP